MSADERQLELAGLEGRQVSAGAAPIGSIPSGLSVPSLPGVPLGDLGALVLPAIAVAALAIVFTLTGNIVGVFFLMPVALITCSAPFSSGAPAASTTLAS